MTQPPPDSLLTAIRVSGSDRTEFLQGQFTQDLSRLTPQQPLLAGWNSPKGRLFLVSWLANWQEAVWIAVPSLLADGIAKRLAMFVLRADVRIEASKLPVYPLTCNDFDKGAITSCIYNDNCMRIHASGGAWQVGGETPDCSQAAWRLANIRAGLPVIWPDISEAFVPQMVNLDRLNGISFTKGCYVGQEIVARTQNLGRIKRRMFRFGCDAEGIRPGDPVVSAGKSAGTVVDAVDGELLAVVQLEKLTAELTVADSALRLLELPYSLAETG